MVGTASVDYRSIVVLVYASSSDAGHETVCRIAEVAQFVTALASLIKRKSRTRANVPPSIEGMFDLSFPWHAAVDLAKQTQKFTHEPGLLQIDFNESNL